MSWVSNRLRDQDNCCIHLSRKNPFIFISCYNGFFLSTFPWYYFPHFHPIGRGPEMCRKNNHQGKRQARRNLWPIVHCLRLVWITLGFSLVLPLVLGLDPWVFSGPPPSLILCGIKKHYGKIGRHGNLMDSRYKFPMHKSLVFGAKIISAQKQEGGEERILLVTKKSGNRERCRKLSLWNCKRKYYGEKTVLCFLCPPTTVVWLTMARVCFLRLQIFPLSSAVVCLALDPKYR